MSKAELILPGTEEEDSLLVNRFSTASRELVPSVQITLAKRIIRPGSNRVVCLAARTSVPLNDDEVASVSDLALRLSDGTNVALSLSFFNENCATEYATFTHNYYDPHRYPEQSDSKLGMVVVATALAAAAAFFSVVQGPLNSLVNPKTAFAFVNVPFANWSLPRPATSPTVLPAKPVTTTKPAPKTVTKKVTSTSRPRVRQSRGRTAKTARYTGRSMFVPPPPPFAFTLPSGRPMSPYDIFPTMTPPANTAKPAKPAAQKPAAQTDPEPRAKSSTAAKSAPQSTSPASRPAPEREPAATTPPPATKMPAAHEQAATASRPAPATTTPPVQSRSAAVTTPSPQTRSATDSQPVTRNVPEREPAARTSPHRSIWERPDAQIAPPQQRATPADNQLRAPVPGDDAPTPQSPKFSTVDQASHSAAPVHPKFEAIPWPD